MHSPPPPPLPTFHLWPSGPPRTLPLLGPHPFILARRPSETSLCPVDILPPPPPPQAFWNLPLLGSLNYRVNFQTFPAAMLVLLRIATTDNWSDFFFQMIPGNPACLAYEVLPGAFASWQGLRCLGALLLGGFAVWGLRCLEVASDSWYYLLQGSDCGSWLSIPYCLAFLFLVAFIMLNLLM